MYQQSPKYQPHSTNSFAHIFQTIQIPLYFPLILTASQVIFREGLRKTGVGFQLKKAIKLNLKKYLLEKKNKSKVLLLGNFFKSTLSYHQFSKTSNMFIVKKKYVYTDKINTIL